ncbi:MAG TPA: type II toxin-antitoxin system VapB family antitoxin [Burkholderiaceae bacterium]|nr:type II toxin-antitoxin system VapB family antitoxin [Burkholderiaceae bacterium]
MATNLAPDPKLLDQVLELSGEQTKKAAVTLALKEFIARREQRKPQAPAGVPAHSKPHPSQSYKRAA